LIATASGDDTGALWSRAKKQRIATLSGHTDTVVQVAFNTSGSLLATAGMDGVVKVWNSADGALVATLEGPGEDITFINWHSKGDVLLAGSSDASVWMWNAVSGSCMAVLSGHSESVTCGMFSQDGKTVMTASADGSARVWNPKDSTCLVSMSDPKGIGTFHSGPITCLDTKGDLLLTGSEDATAILTTLTMSAGGAPTGKVSAQAPKHAHAACILFRWHLILTPTLILPLTRPNHSSKCTRRPAHHRNWNWRV
jgi:WD40 repeat protein